MMRNEKHNRASQFSMRLCVCALMMLCILTIQIGSATVFYQNGSEIPGDTVIETLANTNNISSTPFPIQFFYNTQCGSCQGAIEYLKGFTANNSDIAVQSYDLQNSTTNMSLLDNYKVQFNSKNIHYPVIFVGNVAVVGK